MYNVNNTSRQKRSDNFCLAIRDAIKVMKSEKVWFCYCCKCLCQGMPNKCLFLFVFIFLPSHCVILKGSQTLIEEHFSLPKIWPPTLSPNTTHQIIPIPRCSLPHLRFNISPYWALQFSMIMTTFWWYCVKPVHYKYSCRSAKKIRKYECNKKDTFQSKSCVFPLFFQIMTISRLLHFLWNHWLLGNC